MTYDALIIGAGPAGLAIAASLCNAGVRVAGLTIADPTTPWVNTYGIWRDELEALGLNCLLAHSWSDCTIHAAGRERSLPRVYGLLDNARLQSHLLARCNAGGMTWLHGAAAGVEHSERVSHVSTQTGAVINARIVIDASGHFSALAQRPRQERIAYQAAFGMVGRFSTPPVRAGQMMLMDFRYGHLAPEEKRHPPTFLYAMDLGDDRFFVEETSLAHAPALPFDLLEQRLHQRLRQMGTQAISVEHVERCLFPMNMALPDLRQPVFAYGGAASMVHPISGYQVGAALRHAPVAAQAIARALAEKEAPPGQIARHAWQTLWPGERIRRRNLYLFGLESLMSFDAEETNQFFAAFFALPHEQWSGYLSDRLSTPEVLAAMWGVFRRAPQRVRVALVRSVGASGSLLWRSLR